MENIGKFNTIPVSSSLELDKKDRSKVGPNNQETRHTQKYNDAKGKKDTITLQERGIKSIKDWLHSINSEKRTLVDQLKKLEDIHETLTSCNGSNLKEQEQEKLLGNFISIRDSANETCDNFLNIIDYVRKNKPSLLNEDNEGFINSIDSEDNKNFAMEYVNKAESYYVALEGLGIRKNRMTKDSAKKQKIKSSSIPHAEQLKILSSQLDSIFKRKL